MTSAVKKKKTYISKNKRLLLEFTKVQKEIKLKDKDGLTRNS